MKLICFIFFSDTTMPVRKGLLAPQNTFLDTIATRFDGTRKFRQNERPKGQWRTCDRESENTEWWRNNPYLWFDWNNLASIDWYPLCQYWTNGFGKDFILFWDLVQVDNLKFLSSLLKLPFYQKNQHFAYTVWIVCANLLALIKEI